MLPSCLPALTVKSVTRRKWYVLYYLVCTVQYCTVPHVRIVICILFLEIPPYRSVQYCIDNVAGCEQKRKISGLDNAASTLLAKRGG
jgi:hypothetical protein